MKGGTHFTVATDHKPLEERLESVRIGKCQNAFFFKIGKCQNRKVSKLENVRIGKCQNWKVSESESVRIGKCQNRKVSKLENVRIGKCQDWKVSELDIASFGFEKFWSVTRKMVNNIEHQQVLELETVLIMSAYKWVYLICMMIRLLDNHLTVLLNSIKAV